MKTFFSFIFLVCCSFHVMAVDSKLLTFEFEGETLSGVLSTPTKIAPKALILIMHGYGETNAVEGNWHADIRSAMHKAGFATYMWDKMGCGGSTGSFDINQPVENSADEAIAAIKMLRQQKQAGANKIGLWGGSRASWINPIVIQKQQDIKFWISISGVDDKENFSYLLEKNAIIAGDSPEQARIIANEWIEGGRIAKRGGSYSEYKSATRNLAENDLWLKFTDGGIGWFDYFFFKRQYRDVDLDEQTGLPIVVHGFEEMLQGIEFPVLGLFGELDMNVDWRKTRALYQRTLNKELLTIEVFENCNHSMFEAKTGGYYEFEGVGFTPKRCNGYVDVTYKWLLNLEL